jgi:ATP-dependent Clp protease ATP-binding subunit ClpC
MADRFDRFTERARQALTLAQVEAERLSHDYIGTEHLLLGLVRQDECLAVRVLDGLGVPSEKVDSAIGFIIGRGDRPVPPEMIGLTPRAKRAIELSVDEARRLNHHYIGTEHLLLGLVREGEGIAARVLESIGVTLPRARSEVVRLLSRGRTQGGRPRAARTVPDVVPHVGEERSALGRALDAVRAARVAAVSEQNEPHVTALREIEVTLERMLES